MTLLRFTAVLGLGLVGCKGTIDYFIPPAAKQVPLTQLKGASNAAIYVHTHHCVLENVIGPSETWDDATNRFEHRGGYKDWQCDGHTDTWIYVYDADDPTGGATQ